MIKTYKLLSNSIAKFAINLHMSQSIVINAKHQLCAILVMFNGRKIKNKNALLVIKIHKSLKN
jgi:hypothetical protein